ncbi:MAG: DNA repair protein RecN [Bacteroidia bacterium]
MISKLYIKNYALIKELDLELGKNLNIVTGETGAGKSIMLGALGLLLGNRADAKAIEYTNDKCVIEGHFLLAGLGLKPFFANQDLDYEEHSILRREISKSGKSRAFINDTPVTLHILKELGEKLVDIHSQHSNLLLKSQDFRRNFIDFMADSRNEVENFKNAYTLWKTSRLELESLKQKESELRSTADFNKFQFNEIDELKLEPSEYTQNEHELDLLNNSERISDAFAMSLQLLDEGDGTVLEKLSEMRNATQKLTELDERLAQFNERINSSYLELQDLSSEINSLKDEWTFDEQRLSYLNERQEKIQRLFRKHNTESIEELLILADSFKEQFNQAANFEDAILKLENEVAKKWIAVLQTGKKLSNKRKKSSVQIGDTITETLKQLGIPDANFHVEIESHESNLSAKNGFDNFNFNFSANKGIGLKDVSQVASGGEISRIMLALKALMSESNQFPTLIFDEIDLGISGEVAIKMGALMQELSQKHQLVCITHLPQIAAMGQRHFKVEKTSFNDKSFSTLKQLGATERITEIGEMIGGEQAGESALQSAKELLQKFAATV